MLKTCGRKAEDTDNKKRCEDDDEKTSLSQCKTDDEERLNDNKTTSLLHPELC